MLSNCFNFFFIIFMLFFHNFLNQFINTFFIFTLNYDYFQRSFLKKSFAQQFTTNINHFITNNCTVNCTALTSICCVFKQTVYASQTFRHSSRGDRTSAPRLKTRCKSRRESQITGELFFCIRRHKKLGCFFTCFCQLFRWLIMRYFTEKNFSKSL